MGIKKVNTTVYHLQTGGLVERSISVLRQSKTMKKSGVNICPIFCILFAYRTSVQEFTKVLPFYLLYGRDARLPTDDIINAKVSL